MRRPQKDLLDGISGIAELEREFEITAQEERILSICALPALLGAHIRNGGWLSYTKVIALMDKIYGRTLTIHALEMAICRLRRRLAAGTINPNCLQTHRRQVRLAVRVTSQDEPVARKNPIVESLLGGPLASSRI